MVGRNCVDRMNRMIRMEQLNGGERADGAVSREGGWHAMRQRQLTDGEWPAVS
jgi:hypothetical protein